MTMHYQQNVYVDKTKQWSKPIEWNTVWMKLILILKPLWSELFSTEQSTWTWITVLNSMFVIITRCWSKMTARTEMWQLRIDLYDQIIVVDIEISNRLKYLFIGMIKRKISQTP